MSALPFILLPLIAALAAQVTGIPEQFGAHPYWSDKVIWIGLVIGLGAAWAAAWRRLSQTATLAATAFFAIAAFLLARAGKEGFAASYGEDVISGQIWFFGWIATCAFTAASLATLLRPDAPDH